MSETEKITKRLLQAIQDSGYSYAELEKRSNISKSALQRYATGTTKKIPLDVIETLAPILNVTPAYLMGWDTKRSVESKTTKQINMLSKLIKHSEASLNILSILCKNIRIEQKLFEEEVAKKAGISLEDYLLFEEIGSSISAESALNILDALDISYSYAIGYINALQKGNLYKLLKDPLTRNIVERITALDKDQLKLLKTRLENLIKE
ncbi:MAG: helix-turn-helix domain-containing protein [Beduini sp.]|uniref:helix-turn-helix domain-containing protein n=1 Tax=Beduini sp. TaxID=1922300 RepID=UPI0039A2C387